MDYVSTGQAAGVSGARIDSLPPVLLAAQDDDALQRARSSIEAAGGRVGAALSLDDLGPRLDIQPTMSALWVELAEDGGPAMDAALARIDGDVAAGRYHAIVAAPAALVDPLSAAIADPRIDVLIDADPATRAATLALALGATSNDRVHDVASDGNNARLRQLSDEVNRIAATLARLSSDAGRSVSSVIQPLHGGAVPEVSADLVRAAIRARRLRGRYFKDELFADPAWDMLLDLLHAELTHVRVPVSSLCIAAAVPATTALRWLKSMVDEGLFIRRADPHDGRRVFVELAPEASRAMHHYFSDLGLAVAA